MRVGIIAHDAYPIRQPYQRNIDRTTYLLCRELHARAYDVTVLCKRGSDLSGRMVYYDNYENGGEDTAYNRAVAHFPSLNFDLVHNHSLKALGIRISNRLSIPHITTFHTPILPEIRQALQQLENKGRPHFSAVSRRLADLYEKHIPSLHIIHNGLDLSSWQWGFPPEQYLSWSGGIEPGCGLTTAIRLCDGIGVPLKFAGRIDNSEYYEKKVLPLMEGDSNSSYSGHLSHYSLNEMVGRATAYISTHKDCDPYCLAVTEALASGVPVLASDKNLADELLDGTCGRWFDPEDPLSFKAAYEASKAFNREDCRKKAERLYTHYAMIDAYEKLYYSVLEEGVQYTG